MTTSSSRPPRTEALVETLTEELKALQNSPRYEMVKGLQVAHLFQKADRLPKELLNASLEDLVRLGAWRVARIKGLGPTKLQQLVNLLHTLSGTDEEMLSAPPMDSPLLDPITMAPAPCITPSWEDPEFVIFKGSPPTRPNPPRGEPPMASVEAEQKLSTAFERLKSSVWYPELKGKLVRDFWDSEWPKAPFIECLTLSQVSGMNPESLLEKRSFGSRKAIFLLKAIERALAAKDEVVRSQGLFPDELRPEVAKVAVPPSVPNSRVYGAPEWRESTVELPMHLQSFLREIEEQLAKPVERESFARRLLKACPPALTKLEFVILALVNEHPVAVVASLLHLSSQEIEARVRAAEQKLGKQLHDMYPSEAQLLHLLLKSTVVPGSLILGLFADDTFSAPLRALIRTIVLAAFDGKKITTTIGDSAEFWINESRWTNELFGTLQALASDSAAYGAANSPQAELLLPLLSAAEREALLASVHATAPH